MTPALEARLARCATLPTLPAVAMRVLDLCRDADPNLDEITKAISSDAALSAKLLRMVNSPAFGLRQEVKTVRHAIALLGLMAIRTLALSFSLAQGLKKTQQSGFKAYWKRSVMAAVAARELASLTRACDREEAFLGGLLQDIGIMALGQISTKKFVNLSNRQDDHSALVVHEHEEFGTDHAEAGAWLAERWQLPAGFVAAIRHSHDPVADRSGSNPALSSLVAVVAVSGLVADVWTHPDPRVATQRARQVARDLLGTDETTFTRLLDNTRSHADEVAQILDADLGTRAELTAILEQARDALVMLSMTASQQVVTTQRALTSLEARTRELEMESQKDALTGVANRGFLDRVLEDEFTMAAAAGRAVSVIMVDLDRFKLINDTHGHQSGDRVLQAAALILQTAIRPRDFVGRYGGEEFLLVLPDTPPSGACIVAERLRAKLESSPVVIADGPTINVTACFGCASTDPRIRLTKTEVLASADRALYRAKETGRNRVVSAAEACPQDDVPSPRTANG